MALHTRLLINLVIASCCLLLKLLSSEKFIRCGSLFSIRSGFLFHLGVDSYCHLFLLLSDKDQGEKPRKN